MHGAEELKETQVLRFVLSLAFVRHVMLLQDRPLVFRGYPGRFQVWNDEWICIQHFGRRKQAPFNWILIEGRNAKWADVVATGRLPAASAIFVLEDHYHGRALDFALDGCS
jgi:hypothetical protein